MIRLALCAFAVLALPALNATPASAEPKIHPLKAGADKREYMKITLKTVIVSSIRRRSR